MVPDLEALLSHLASPAGNQGLSSAPVQEAALPLPLPLASSSSLSPSLASLPPPFPPSRNPPPLPPAIPLPPPPPTPPLEPRLTRARTNGGARQSLREGSISDGDDGSDFHDDENDDDERAEKASGWAKARKTRWTPQEVRRVPLLSLRWSSAPTESAKTLVADPSRIPRMPNSSASSGSSPPSRGPRLENRCLAERPAGA